MSAESETLLLVPDAGTTSPVEGALERMDAALHRFTGQYVRRVREGLSRFQSDLHVAQQAHAAGRKRLTDAVATPEMDEHATWMIVRSYATTTQEAVWDVLRASLQHARLGGRLLDGRTELDTHVDALPGDLPEEIERPEPDGLLAPNPDDALGLRLRKSWRRAGRTVRGVFRTPEPPRQQVPVAALVRHHLSTRVSPAYAEILQDVEQQLAQWTAGLERTAQAWTHRVLEAERMLDAAWHHAASTDLTEQALDRGDDPDALPATPGTRPDPATLLDTILDAAEMLDACLLDGLALSLDDLQARFDDACAAVAPDLREDVRLAGVQPPSTPSTVSLSSLFDRPPDTSAWPQWYARVEDRLSFLSALCEARRTVLQVHQDLTYQVADASVTPLKVLFEKNVDVLEQLRDEADARLDVPEDGTAFRHARAFERFVETADEEVVRSLIRPLEEMAPRREMRDAVDACVRQLRTFVRKQPEAFDLHPISDPNADRVRPTRSTDPLPWREVVEAGFNTLLFDAWRDALSPLAHRVEASRDEVMEIQTVVSFHLGAALEELQDRVAASRRSELDGGAGGDSYLRGARELALGGLDRSCQSLTAALDRVTSTDLPFVETTWAASTRAWSALHDRARTAGQTREHLLRFESWMAHLTRDISTVFTNRFREASLKLQRSTRRLRRQTSQLVRLGQSAVGGGPVDAEARQQTIEALSTIDQTMESIPLIYRRLFSFRPIMDPDLLVGRDADLSAIATHAAQWDRGLCNVLVLTSTPGAGLTSLLNAARKTTYRGTRVHTVDLTDRVTSEAELAQRVAGGLGLRGDDFPTLDAVDAALREAAASASSRRVCFVERLEHTFLRTIGGTACAASFLSFLSETDSLVLWVVTCSTPSWQVLEANEPDAARLVQRRDLTPLTREEVERLIMVRHRRSGLHLRFQPPSEQTHPILSRRLRVARDDESKQALLRSSYFDDLYQRSGQNVMLALYYWVRSVTLDDAGSQIDVAPLRPIRFDALDDFKLPLAFALKALVEHATLTPLELATVLQVSPSVGSATMETLGNAQLIAPVDPLGVPGTYRFSGVSDDARYRIRPLVLHPVLRDLRSRNVLH